MTRETITVQRFYTDHSAKLDLKLLSGAAGLQRRILEPTVNRPGLALAGHTKYFARHRVQVMGHAEVTYLRTLPRALRQARYAMLFGYQLPCVVFCRDHPPEAEEVACERPQKCQP